MNEIGVEFTLQELGVIADLLDLPTAAGIEDNPIDDLPEELRGPVVESIIGSLEARQILTRTDDSVVVAEPIQLIVTAASAPSLIAIVSKQVDTLIDTTFLSVTPDIAVEVGAVAHTVYRLTPFATSDLLARVLRLSDLHPSSEMVEVEPLDLSQDQLEKCAEALLDADDPGALEALGGSNPSSDAFLRALKAKRSSSQVTIVHQPGEGRVEGGTIAWIEAGLRGVWTTEAVEEEGEPTGMVHIACADARDIAMEMFTYLPDVFSADEPLATDD